MKNTLGDELMKKLLIIPFVILILFFNTTTVHSSPLLGSKDLISIYNETFDFYVKDASLAKVKNYIAIDMNTKALKKLSASDKLKILNYMQKYNTSRINVIAASMEDLKAKGLVEDNKLYLHGLSGLLLEITDIEVISNSKVIVEGNWYASKASSENIHTVLIKENGTWKIKKSS